MPVPYFYYPDLNSLSGEVVLDEETSRHIVQVLRMQSGEEVRLTDGKGNLSHSVIRHAHKKKCTVSHLSIEQLTPPKRKLAIGISLIKNSARFEWFLEKATEIGISEIIPLICERTEKKDLRIDRMHSILVSAMLQSQQSWLPEIQEPIILRKGLETFKHQQKFIAYVSDDHEAHLSDLINSNLNSQIVLIGPEGDFTLEEIDLAMLYNFLPASLGPNRLRTETAGLVALTLLNAD
ncbi:rRNA methyltransferase [Candidatus Cerribacteria bacterium 'Amazon FNV 2010 28 9']|uniref:Ribosomal RNA small subunit methyltransferase E n=1 Tax=Candidatus Cerribacteria bacterium 'Amazon FNV 2010 28 9' TaxID=2081795 RepID=A0A317JNV1_9BACT|nr:MAG: rRNA methyltransferase [Candidatus Cerribacteria bacterium 'Amazon FNV 2010 28 9']